MAGRQNRSDDLQRPIYDLPGPDTPEFEVLNRFWSPANAGLDQRAGTEAKAMASEEEIRATCGNAGQYRSSRPPSQTTAGNGPSG